MRKNTTLLIFLLVCGVAFSQTSTIAQKIDSIQYLLADAKGKNTLQKLQKAVVFAEELQIDSLVFKTNDKYGSQCYIKKNIKGLGVAQQNLNKLYVKSKDSFALAKSYHYKALLHLLNVKQDSSLYYYIESKKISALIKDSLEVGRRLLSMANIQRQGKDYLGSEVSSIEALRYLEPINDYIYRGSVYNNLALVAKRKRNYDESRKYLDKAKEIHQKNPNKRRKEIAYFNYLLNYGITYVEESNIKTAIKYYKKGLENDSLKIKYPRIYTMFSDNLSNKLIEIGQLDKAIVQLKSANKILKSINDKKRLSTNYNGHFKYYYTIKDYKNAYKYALLALKYAKESNNVIRESNVLYRLAFYDNLVSEKEKNIYLRNYIKLNDSLIKVERNTKDQFAKIRYETGKKEKENTALKVENDKKQLLLESEQQQKIISILMAVGFLLLFVISIIVFNNRRKKLAFEAQLQKAEVREHERQQIAKSLHDEVAGDLRVLHQQLEKTNQTEVAEKLDVVKNNVRNLSHQLSSVSFDEVSFKDQIINLVSDYFSVNCKITIKGLKEYSWSSVKNPIKRALFLSIRESLQNADKYAKATQINITLHQDKSKVYLTVKDNGVGFDVSSVKKGIGLKNQQERIKELNGSIAITSKIEKGTTISIEIPMYG